MDGLSNGLLSEIDVALSPRAAATVTLASEGYPGAYEKGKTLTVPSLSDLGEDQLVFHAGTQLKEDQVLSSGGRVAACVGLGTELEKAVAQAYDLAGKVTFEGKTHRTDIGSV